MRHSAAIKLAGVLALVLSTSMAPGASADPIADFYKGKQLRMIIGYAPGGGYDLYGRLAAEFLGRFIPGHPTIVAQNMPGAGSFKAAKWIYAVAPKDGSVFGSVDQALALNSVSTWKKGEIDVTKFRYVGRLTSNVDVGVGLPGAPFHTFDDARQHEIVVGVTTAASSAVLLPTALKEYGGAKFKLVRGYKGAAEIMVALEQHEVQLVGGVGVPVLLTHKRDWILKHTAPILYQNALERHPLLPNVPTLPELGLTSEGKTVLRAIASTGEIGRSILTTPDVPPDRLAALRKAFKAMIKDPEFTAIAKKRHIEITPGTGEQMDKIVRDTTMLPKPVLAKLTILAGVK
jgi:tripartite-type tricarboxylate transporter receptor subunit TctC